MFDFKNSKVFRFLRWYASFSIKKKITIFIMLVLVFSCTSLITRVAIKYLTLKDQVVQITGKERIVKTTGEGVNSFYLVYTDKDTYKLVDDVVILRWSSSDDYGKLKQNSCYSVSTYGLRAPLFSWYRNIYNITETSCIAK